MSRINKEQDAPSACIRPENESGAVLQEKKVEFFPYLY